MIFRNSQRNKTDDEEQSSKLLLFDFQGLLEREKTREKRNGGKAFSFSTETVNFSLFTFTSYGGVAQLGEHLPCKQGVKGSNPFISTIG